MAKVIRDNPEAAGIECIDGAGRVADFHSLRYSTASLLAASGAQPKVAQELMRHSEINLTMNAYTHALKGQQSEAVERSGDLSVAVESEESGAAGTDGFAESLSKTCFSGVREGTQGAILGAVSRPKAAETRWSGDNAGSNATNCQEITNAGPIIRVRAASKERTAPVEACATSHRITAITGQKDEA
jgi:hypothetical protein